MSAKALLLGVLGGTLALETARPAPTTETLPSFSLQEWGGTNRIHLEEFADQILVLDFFAWWCAPCEPASKALTRDIEMHYAANSGNPHRIPVRVLSVNVEPVSPQKTAAFIERTGIRLVANEFTGEWLEELGGDGLPFLLIVDGTAAAPGIPRFRIVHRQTGLDSTADLRRRIDSLGAAQAPPVNPADPTSSAGPPPPSPAPRVHYLELMPEVVWSSDIFLTDSRVSYRQSARRTDWTVALSYASFDMDYRPFTPVDFFGYDERLSEERVGADLSLRVTLNRDWSLLASAGAYEGYPDYRRVWIANRYRQKYDNPDFPRIPGYEPPDPKGANGSVGVRWEYLPSSGIAELRLGHARDRTAPGYEDGLDGNGDFALLRGAEHIRTFSVSLSSENVLTPRVRLLNEAGWIEVSERQLRFTYRGSLNVALGERWVLRGYGGISRENPDFDAWFAGGTLEYEALPGLLAGLTGRYYEDTGEIQNSLLSSSAAPPLRSWEAGLSLRFTWSRCSIKLQAGPFETDYQLQGGASDEFLHLYRDRSWGLAQAALSTQF